jgi:DNA-directed RNA polymerase subunit RPC12/RpoP
MAKVFYLKCDHCTFKDWSDGSDESFKKFVEVVTCKNCGGPRKIKCPQCGFLVKARKYVEPPLPKDHIFGK